MSRRSIVRAGLCAALLVVLGLAGAAADAGEAAFALARDPHGMVVKRADGRPVLRYMTARPEGCPLTANSLCCFHPLYTPSGQELTALAPDDHRHHRGAFLAWYAMEGGKKADFWGWGQFAPTKGRVIENRSIDLVAADPQHAELRIRNDWMADGEAMVQEELRVAARAHEAGHVVDLTYRLAPAADTAIAQSSFGGFCVRFRKDGKAVFSDPNGEVKLPAPHYLKPETCWPAADWYDYSVTLGDGKTVGMAVVDHPGNPPTRWHNNRGVWVINPCVTAPASLTMKKGEPLVLRYRLVAHDGPAPAEALKALAADWRKP